MLTQNDLDQFCGTEHYYRHGIIPGIVYTDGVQFLAEQAKCYWLLDEIALAQLDKTVKAEEFQVWKLTVSGADRSATLVCEDGNYNVVQSKKITFTDFPLESISIWLENGVMYLPGER